MPRKTGRPPLPVVGGNRQGVVTVGVDARSKVSTYAEVMGAAGGVTGPATATATGWLAYFIDATGRAIAGSVAFLVDVVNGKLRLTSLIGGPGVDQLVLNPASTGVGAATLTAHADADYQQVGFGMEEYVATDALPAYLWKHVPAGGVGLEVIPDAVLGDPISFDHGVGLAVGTALDLGDVLPNASRTYQYGGLGAGAVAGMTHEVQRNDDGAGAAGSLCLVDRAGTKYFFWVAAGVLRFGTARPTEDDSVNHTSGAPV